MDGEISDSVIAWISTTLQNLVSARHHTSCQFT